MGWHTINGNRRAHHSGCLGGYGLWERGRGLVNDGLRPEGNVVGIAFEQQSVGHAEEQAGLGIIYRVVIDIDAVGNRCHTLAVEDGPVVAGTGTWV